MNGVSQQVAKHTHTQITHKCKTLGEESCTLTHLVGALQVLVPLLMSEKEMWRYVICMTHGIHYPRSSWTINNHVVKGHVAMAGCTFEPLTAKRHVDIDLLNTWESVATGRVSLNESRNESITLHCRHMLADGSYIWSEPFLCKHSE